MRASRLMKGLEVVLSEEQLRSAAVFTWRKRAVTVTFKCPGCQMGGDGED